MRSNEKFSQRAETAIEKARLSARDLGHSSVGTEHLLLGILTESEGLGARILLRRGLPVWASHISCAGCPAGSSVNTGA